MKSDGPPWSRVGPRRRDMQWRATRGEDTASDGERRRATESILAVQRAKEREARLQTQLAGVAGENAHAQRIKHMIRNGRAKVPCGKGMDCLVLGESAAPEEWLRTQEQRHMWIMRADIKKWLPRG